MLRRLADATTDLLTVLDAEGRVLWASPSWATMGYSPAALVGQRISELIHPDDLPSSQATLADALARGSGKALVRARAADGAWRRHNVVAYPVPEVGQARIITVALDVTEHGDAAERLRASSERLRAILLQSPISTQILSPDGLTVEANPAFYDLWGIAPEVIKDYNILHDPQVQRKGILPFILRAFAGEVVRVPPVRYDPAEIGKPGRARWVRAVVYPVLGPAGEVREVVIQHEDVTDERDAVAELRQANERLRDAEEARARLVNMAAHELKTPLTPIRLQMVLLKARPQGLSEQQTRAIALLERNVDRLDHLVDDVLDATRLQGGHLAIAREPLDVSRVVGEAVESFREALEHSGLTLESELAPGLAMDGDARRLTQVVYNLLSNAIKFTPAGGRVRVTAARQGDQAVVRVTDTGVGLPPEDIAQLFRPFTQLRDPRHTTTGGSGLGLFISSGIVAQHGGRMWAESPGPGQGSTFSFALPLSKAAALPPPPAASRRPARAPAEERSLARRLREAL